MDEIKNSYIFPVTTYLNQNIVFDLLAVIEDGFAQVTNLNVSNTKGKSVNSNTEGEAGFGLYGIKTKIKAAIGMERSTTEEKSSNEERVHTPTSLFAKLISYLDENQLIYDIPDRASLNELSVGSFVRFNSRLEKNPLISLFESIEQIIVIAMSFQTIKKGNKKNNEQDILKQVKGMKNSLTENQIMDLICTINEEENLKAVLPVYLNFFVHNNMNEIIDGNYTILGKVVKVVNEEEQNINLFRNTAFKLFKQTALDDLFQSMNAGLDEQLEIPNIVSRISCPSLLVIPIAIYS
jgi:hypothetical protein